MRLAAKTLVFAALAVSACGGEDEAAAPSSKPEVTGSLPAEDGLLFLLRGDGSVGDETIEVRSQTVDWFTDRPQRRAGTAAANELVSNWKGYGFARVAPNAAVVGGAADAEVVLSRPAEMEDGLLFEFKTIHGSLPATEDEQIIVFIDGSGNGSSGVTVPGWIPDGAPSVIGYGTPNRFPEPQENSGP